MPGDLISLRQSDAFYADLDALHLTAPTIQVTDVLQARMQRHGRQLELDEAALTDGIRAIEPERPILIRFDSQPKGKYDVDPTVAFHEGSSWYDSDEPTVAQIGIKPNLSKADAENGASRKLNEAFWLGVVVCDALAEGTGDSLRAEMEKQAKRRPKKEFVVTLLAGAATDGAMTAAHLGFDTSLGIALGVEAAIIIRMAKKRTSRTPDFDNFLAGKFEDRAASLASQHRVLRQSFTEA
jgi:hypothetical protein